MLFHSRFCLDQLGAASVRVEACIRPKERRWRHRLIPPGSERKLSATRALYLLGDSQPSTCCNTWTHTRDAHTGRTPGGEVCGEFQGE